MLFRAAVRAVLAASARGLSASDGAAKKEEPGRAGRQLAGSESVRNHSSKTLSSVKAPRLQRTDSRRRRQKDGSLLDRFP